MLAGDAEAMGATFGGDAEAAGAPAGGGPIMFDGVAGVELVGKRPMLAFDPRNAVTASGFFSRSLSVAAIADFAGAAAGIDPRISVAADLAACRTSLEEGSASEGSGCVGGGGIRDPGAGEGDAPV
jgi:hypothetical protein